MSEEEFLKGIVGGNTFREAVDALASTGQPYCLIGGLAVNQYAEPMVTLDADFACQDAESSGLALQKAGFKVHREKFSINAHKPASKLSVQLTLNSGYAPFPRRARPGRVFDVNVPVARLRDLVQGKLWALQDSTCRPSKKMKDRLDLVRLCETRRDVIRLIPTGLIPEVDAMRSKRSLKI